MANGKTAAAFPQLNALLEDSPEISLTDTENIFSGTLYKVSSSDKSICDRKCQVSKAQLVRNPIALEVTKFGDDIPAFQEPMVLQEIKSREKFAQLPGSGFWSQVKNKLIPIREADKVLLSFPTTLSL